MEQPNTSHHILSMHTVIKKLLAIDEQILITTNNSEQS